MSYTQTDTAPGPGWWIQFLLDSLWDTVCLVVGIWSRMLLKEADWWMVGTVSP